MRTCTACSTTTDESGHFCPECGAALQAMQHDPGAGASSSSATRLIGMTIDGQFKIESILGGGAFGTVYKGVQVGLDRPVAIKVPTHEIAVDPVMAKRFAREAKSAARVQHPGVVAIYAVGELDDHRPYLAMQFVDGQSLDKILAEGPVDVVRALQIARLVASALSETHAADVVHRDLKPSNIVWRRDRNGDDQVTLVDFGIAVCKPGNAEATRLTSGGLIGTPHYMSPEQAHGELVDARADLYALGCILFELVTGAPPFEGSGFEVLLAHLGRKPPLPSEKATNIPECIDKLCAILMAKKPDQRPQSADDVVALIDQALGELEGKRKSKALATQRPVRRTNPPAPRTLVTLDDLPDGTVLPRHRRKRRMLVVAAGVLTLAIAGFAGYELRSTTKVADADPVDDIDNDPRVGSRRSLFKDNGEMRVQLLVPDPVFAGQEIRSRLEVKNKLGQPVIADEIVLTIADETGAAKGITARPRRQSSTTGSASSTAEPPTPGRYYFRYTFAKPGRYVLRVFPPSVDSSFEIPIDVQ